MSNEKDPKKLRKIFVTTNKYQRDIILLSFLPTASIFLAFNCVVAIANPSVSMALFHTTLFGMKNSAAVFSGIIVFLMCTFFLLSLVGAFILSHNMIGAFERIIKELDDIIAGRSEKTIYSRPKDTLTKEMLKRINILIEFYVANKKKEP